MTHPYLNTSLMVNDSVGVNESVAYNYSTASHPGIFTIDIATRVRYLLAQPHNAVALILGFLAITLNILSILAVLKMHGILTSHYRFIVSLAVSDILIGLTVSAFVLNNAVNPMLPPRFGSWGMRIRGTCAFMLIKAMNTTSLNITLLNLMGMAIDHFLAILKPLHYPSIMNRRRASIMILFFWVLAFLCGFSDFLSVYPYYSHHLGTYNYCELSRENPYQDEYPTFAIAIVCLIIMTFTYVRMFVAVRQRHENVGMVHQELQRNKKALFTTLLILFSFVACWLPLCLFQIVLIIRVKMNASTAHKLDVRTLSKVDKYLYDLLLLNAILDPIIYAIRMREVKFGYRKLFASCWKHPSKDQHYSVENSHSTVVDIEHRTGRTSLGSIRLLERNSWSRKSSSKGLNLPYTQYQSRNNQQSRLHSSVQL